MSREDPQLKVRLPQELKDKITESASNLGRSINADVVARLEDSFAFNQSQLRENETVIDKDLLKELLAMRKDLLKMSKIIYEEFSNSHDETLELLDEPLISSKENKSESNKKSG